jgi:putative peptide zinc metalloprotease protein
VQIKAIQLAKAVDDTAVRTLATESLQTVERQLTELNEQMRHLTITAPVSGAVVEPPRQPLPRLEEMRTRLARWAGTPLDAKNGGCFLQERTHLLSIAPSNAMVAILYLDQADRHDVFIGSHVSLKFDHLPGRVFRGKISQIAIAQSDFAPEHMSLKHGGLLTTMTDREGKEQLHDAAYQATVFLDESPDLIKPKFRGNARFFVYQRSVLAWLWRYIRRTFQFTL